METEINNMRFWCVEYTKSAEEHYFIIIADSKLEAEQKADFQFLAHHVFTDGWDMINERESKEIFPNESDCLFQYHNDWTP